MTGTWVAVWKHAMMSHTRSVAGVPVPSELLVA